MASLTSNILSAVQGFIKSMHPRVQKLFGHKQGGIIGQVNEACRAMEWQRVRHLLASQVFLWHSRSVQQLIVNDVLKHACQNNEVSTIEFVLGSRSLPVHAEVHHTNEFGHNPFVCCAIHGSHDAMKALWSLVDREEVKQQWVDEAFNHAVTMGNMSLVKILMECRLVDKQPDIYQHDKKGLRQAHFTNNVELANYLLPFYPEAKNLLPYDTEIKNQIFPKISEAIQQHDFDKAKSLLKTANFFCQGRQMQQQQMDTLLNSSCLLEHVEFLKYLLFAPELEELHIPSPNINKTDRYEKSATALSHACENGNLEVVKLLVKAGANISLGEDEALIKACNHGHVDIVKYLLSSPEVLQAGGKHANIHARENHCFMKACSVADLDWVRFLCESPDLAEHADIYAMECRGLRVAFRAGYHDIMNYLVFERNMELRPEIKKMPSLFAPLLSLFEKRDLKKSLEENLTEKKPARNRKL